MKKILLVLFLIVNMLSNFSFAYPVGNPFPPFRIAGNLYYVGTDDLASYLIVTPKGNILINSNLEANVPMIKQSIKKLGFKFSDIKILLIAHGHFDHAAGSQLIKQETHAQYMVMKEDIPVVESGGKLDFHYANDPSVYFPIVKVDRALQDGDKVTLGGTVLTAHLTAGHTKGCTSWTMQVTEHGKAYQVVIVGSLGVNPGYKLVNNPTYPNIAQDYKHALKELKSLRGDIFLGAHAGYFDLNKKYILLHQHGVNPFVDPEGYQKYIARKEYEFYTELAKQTAQYHTNLSTKSVDKFVNRG